jgi:hypothetical protein
MFIVIQNYITNADSSKLLVILKNISSKFFGIPNNIKNNLSETVSASIVKWLRMASTVLNHLDGANMNIQIFFLLRLLSVSVLMVNTDKLCVKIAPCATTLTLCREKLGRIYRSNVKIRWELTEYILDVIISADLPSDVSHLIATKFH